MPKCAQVAERSLFLWNNEYLVSLVTQQRQVIMPLVFAALERNMTHWNPAVQGLTSNIRKMLEELDPELFQECKRQYDQQQVKSHAWECIGELSLERRGGGDDSGRG